MKIVKIIYSFLLFLLIITSTSFCQSQGAKQPMIDSASQLRLYRQNFWNNLPDPVGFTNDYEHLYNDSQLHVLDSIISTFSRKTFIQITIITYDTMLVAEDNMEALNLRIANFWGVGERYKDNGITIGICRGYRKMRIDNGDGIFKILSDAETKQIIDNKFAPSFKAGNFFEGTYIGLKALMDELAVNQKEIGKE